MNVLGLSLRQPFFYYSGVRRKISLGVTLKLRWALPAVNCRSAVPHFRWRYKILGAQIVRLRVSASAVETAFAGAPLPNAGGKEWEFFVPDLQHQSIKFFVNFICYFINKFSFKYFKSRIYRFIF